MTHYPSIVAQIADRIRWWANPPPTVRPTPALAGWSLDEWIERCGVVSVATDERFAKLYPGIVVLGPYEARHATSDALRSLVLSGHVEVCPGRPGLWRAVERAVYRQ